MPGFVKVMLFGSPLARAPVLHSACGRAVASCGKSPTLLKVSVVPALIRIRAGLKPYSTLLAPILIALTPVTIGPVGPATVVGTGGGHNGPSFPFNENTHMASPFALP